jgi:uncharacterized Zn-finger protein
MFEDGRTADTYAIPKTASTTPKVSPEQTQSHGNLHPGLDIVCQDCDLHFPTRSKLDIHSKESLHNAYRCLCGEAFSRSDVLERHIMSTRPGLETECPYCAETFRRPDHVLQHIKGYHRIVDSKASHRRGKSLACPHEACQDEQFSSRTKLRQHLRVEHGEAPFPCTEAHCDKTGSAGYYRRRDLLRHQRDRHSNA